MDNIEEEIKRQDNKKDGWYLNTKGRFNSYDPYYYMSNEQKQKYYETKLPENIGEKAEEKIREIQDSNGTMYVV